jgi:hypothetical protein
MGLIDLVVVVLGALALLLMILEWPKGSGALDRKSVPEGGNTELGYIRQGAVMSANEAAFFRALRSAVGDPNVVLAQLPLSRLIVPAKGDRAAETRARNQIDRKIIDFVIANAESMNVVPAIEVNDSSHHASRRRDRDRFVSDALGQAGVRFLQIPAAGSYDVAQVRAVIARALGGGR